MRSSTPASGSTASTAIRGTVRLLLAEVRALHLGHAGLAECQRRRGDERHLEEAEPPSGVRDPHTEAHARREHVHPFGLRPGALVGTDEAVDHGHAERVGDDVVTTAEKPEHDADSDAADTSDREVEPEHDERLIERDHAAEAPVDGQLDEPPDGSRSEPGE
jgi:hypothetical protein